MAGWHYSITTQIEVSDEEVQIFLEQYDQSWELAALRTLADGRVRYYFRRPRPEN